MEFSCGGFLLSGTGDGMRNAAEYPELSGRAVPYTGAK